MRFFSRPPMSSRCVSCFAAVPHLVFGTQSQQCHFVAAPSPFLLLSPASVPHRFGACSAGDLPTYLNSPAVKQALHVVDIPWVICTGNFSYQRECEQSGAMNEYSLSSWHVFKHKHCVHVLSPWASH